MTDEARTALIQEQFRELQAKYPHLCLLENGLGAWIVRGALRFSASYGACDVIEDEYTIELNLPDTYPLGIPTVRDVSARTSGFHTYQDGTLCLGAPLAVRMTYERNPTLLGFVENCLIPFLYSFSYNERHGKLPYGDLRHGEAGILEYYQELFGTEDISGVLGLLRILADANYRGHLECPCGSGRKLRQCHGDQLRAIGGHQSPDEFMHDYFSVLECARETGVKPPISCRSRRFPQVLKSLQRNIPK